MTPKLTQYAEELVTELRYHIRDRTSKIDTAANQYNGDPVTYVVEAFQRIREEAIDEAIKAMRPQGHWDGRCQVECLWCQVEDKARALKHQAEVDK